MKTRIALSICLAAAFIFGACAKSKTQDELVQPKEWWKNLPRPVYASLEKTGVYQDWFEVYKVAEETYAIYEPYQFDEALSYLVIGKDRAVIIDTGTGIGDISQVVYALTTLPVMVVNTHSHYDHIGGNHYFKSVAIFSNAAEINRLVDGMDNTSLKKHITKESLWKSLPAGFDSTTWTIPPQEPAVLLDEGSAIDLGGRILEVIHTPGHSPGSICLLDKAHKILFTGDTYFPGPLYAFESDANIKDYQASMEKLSARLSEYDHLCPGHNEAWVKSDVIPRVVSAFADIVSGKGAFTQAGELRRYKFDGFDVLVRANAVGK